MDELAIVVGASHAGSQLALSLREHGWTGRVLLLGDEQQLPYHRPPLSKAFLKGSSTVEDLLIRPAATYGDQNIELLLGHRVVAADVDSQVLELSDGRELQYTKLGLATGAVPRKLSIPGSDKTGIHYLRSLDDALNIGLELAAEKRAVIVGGGYIGLELAASLRAMGLNVTVLEAMDRLLQRVTGPEVSEFFKRIHSDNGVSVETTAAVVGFGGGDSVDSVLLEDGRSVPADLVVVGIGVVPETSLAAQLDLKVDDGIVVDEYALTSNRHIAAAGDCTRHPNHLLDQQLRLESVPNAQEQARSAAASLCGKQVEYCQLPWFWSDQYELKLQMAGINRGYDEVIMRGDHHNSTSFSAFYCKQGELIAVDCVNRPQEFMLTRRALSQESPVDVARLSDESISPRDLFSA